MSKDVKPWNGKPFTITNNENSWNLERTIDGDLVLVFQNVSKAQGNVTIEISSGGRALKTITLPPNPDGLPALYINNFGGQNVQIDIIEPAATGVTLAVKVAAVGPGMYKTGPLPMDSNDHLITPIFAVDKCTEKAPYAREGSMPARRATLLFGQRSANIGYFVMFEGGRPTCFAVNWPEGTPLEAPYEPVGENGSSNGNTIMIRRNFIGNTVNVSNISPNVSGESFVRVNS